MTRGTDGDGSQPEGIILLVPSIDFTSPSLIVQIFDFELGEVAEASEIFGGLDFVLAEHVDERFEAIGLVGGIAVGVDAGSHYGRLKTRCKGLEG